MLRHSTPRRDLPVPLAGRRRRYRRAPMPRREGPGPSSTRSGGVLGGPGAASERIPPPLPVSGSRAVVGARARVARASRILVEGVHDAELVERVWGDDLRVEGVVVERLDGIDDLAAEIAAFGPAPGRRVGVLVDHLVPGTKESK